MSIFIYIFDLFFEDYPTMILLGGQSGQERQSLNSLPVRSNSGSLTIAIYFIIRQALQHSFEKINDIMKIIENAAQSQIDFSLHRPKRQLLVAFVLVGYLNC